MVQLDMVNVTKFFPSDQRNARQVMKLLHLHPNDHFGNDRKNDMSYVCSCAMKLLPSVGPYMYEYHYCQFKLIQIQYYKQNVKPDIKQ